MEGAEGVFWTLVGWTGLGLGLWRGLRGHFGPWWGHRFRLSVVEGVAVSGVGICGCIGMGWGGTVGLGTRLWRGLRGR